MQLTPCVPVSCDIRAIGSCYNYNFMLFFDSHETLLALNRRYVGRPLHCVTTFAFLKTWVHLKKQITFMMPAFHFTSWALKVIFLVWMPMSCAPTIMRSATLNQPLNALIPFNPMKNQQFPFYPIWGKMENFMFFNFLK